MVTDVKVIDGCVVYTKGNTVYQISLKQLQEKIDELKDYEHLSKEVGKIVTR